MQSHSLASTSHCHWHFAAGSVYLPRAGGEAGIIL
jgi:hypothetical protein